MLKKPTPILAAFALAAVLSVPAPSALAWEEACVRNAAGSGLAGRFAVVYDYDFQSGMPSQIPHGGAGFDDIYRDAPPHTVTAGSQRAHHALNSGSFPVFQHRCLDLGRIPAGEGFAVYFHALISGRVAHCSTPKDNPDLWLRQQGGARDEQDEEEREEGPYRKIWWKAGGTDLAPRCNFWRETN